MQDRNGGGGGIVQPPDLCFNSSVIQATTATGTGGNKVNKRHHNHTTTRPVPSDGIGRMFELNLIELRDELTTASTYLERDRVLTDLGFELAFVRETIKSRSRNLRRYKVMAAREQKFNDDLGWCRNLENWYHKAIETDTAVLAHLRSVRAELMLGQAAIHRFEAARTRELLALVESIKAEREAREDAS